MNLLKVTEKVKVLPIGPGVGLRFVKFRCWSEIFGNKASCSRTQHTEIGWVQTNNRELSIYTTDGFYDGKTSNLATSPRWMSGPFHVVELGRPADDKFGACANE